MSKDNSGVSSYPIPDLSTPEKTSAWIDQEMLDAQRYFREQVGMPKEVEAPPLVVINIDELEKPPVGFVEKRLADMRLKPTKWKLVVSFEVGIVGAIAMAALATSLTIYLGYSAFVLGTLISTFSK